MIITCRLAFILMNNIANRDKLLLMIHAIELCALRKLEHIASGFDLNLKAIFKNNDTL